MDREPFIAQSDADIEACFPAFSALRPHIRAEEFLPQVRRQQAQGYAMLALRDQGVVRSAAGFRLLEFLAWRRVLYIDDLTTLPTDRSKGYAGQLLDWLIRHAREKRCNAVHLDTGYARHAAHKLYLRKGFELSSHHMALEFRSGD